MNAKKTVMLILVMLLCTYTASAQQNAQFSQYIFNGIYINPAYSGYKATPNADFYYRNQGGTTLTGRPQTINLSVDGSFKEDRMGASMILLNDRAGAERSTKMYANYAYKLKLSEENVLSFGLGAGFSQYGLDGSKHITNENDPDLSYAFESVIVPDLNAGVFYSTEKYYAGLSFYNLIGRYINRDHSANLIIPVTNQTMYLTAGYLFELQNNIKLKPVFLYQNEFGKGSVLDVNALVLLKDFIWLGAGYRAGFGKNKNNGASYTANSLVFLTEVYIKSNIRFGFAYDFSLSTTSNFHYGASEIYLGYIFNSKSKEHNGNRYFEKKSPVF